MQKWLTPLRKASPFNGKQDVLRSDVYVIYKLCNSVQFIYSVTFLKFFIKMHQLISELLINSAAYLLQNSDGL